MTDVGSVPTTVLNPGYLLEASGECLSVADPRPTESVSLRVVSGRRCFVKAPEVILMFMQG